MQCPIKLDKIHCQNCYFAPKGKCQYKKIMATRAESGHVAIPWMLLGMAIPVGILVYCLITQ